MRWATQYVREPLLAHFRNSSSAISVETRSVRTGSKISIFHCSSNSPLRKESEGSSGLKDSISSTVQLGAFRIGRLQTPISIASRLQLVRLDSSNLASSCTSRTSNLSPAGISSCASVKNPGVALATCTSRPAYVRDVTPDHPSSVIPGVLVAVESIGSTHHAFFVQPHFL